MQDENLKEKCSTLKKQYPQKDWRILQIKDLDFTFCLAAYRAAKTFSINGSTYKGIIYVNMIHDLSNGLNPDALTIELIIDAEEFLKSGNFALMLLKKYEI
ncbi:MAG: hypothetical protein Q4E15_09685 [Lactobacillus johnsonii]|nr:hypothetical protein [Lactobacillus johnsonii]